MEYLKLQLFNQMQIERKLKYWYVSEEQILFLDQMSNNYVSRQVPIDSFIYSVCVCGGGVVPVCFALFCLLS